MRRASSASKSRAVNANSRVSEPLPTIFGKRLSCQRCGVRQRMYCSVPMSAARPTWTSRIENCVPLAAIRMSHADKMSRAANQRLLVIDRVPRPGAWPCAAPMTGFEHFSIDEILTV